MHEVSHGPRDRAIEVTAPSGSVVNPEPPADVSSRNLTSMILADAVFNALGQAAPEQAVAAGGAYQGIILSGDDPARGRYFVDYENFAGGQGGHTTGDGGDVMQIHMTNTSNLPVEVMETEFSVRVERYEMITDSGGPGKWRGGLGVCRELRLTAPALVLASRSARQRFAAAGLNGGRAGARGIYLLNPGTEGERRLPGTASELAMAENDLLRVLTPGGGGFGPAFERPPERVLRDVQDGKVSPEAAASEYGVVIRSAIVDADGTTALRRKAGKMPGKMIAAPLCCTLLADFGADGNRLRGTVADPAIFPH